jgi:hypothetical protein
MNQMEINMKLSMFNLAAAATFALLLSALAQTSAAAQPAKSSPPIRIVSDTHVHSISVQVGTVVKFCLIDDARHKKVWEFDEWDGTAVDFYGDGHVMYLSDLEVSLPEGCPYGTTFVAKFRAREVGHSTVHFQYRDSDVPVGAHIRVLDWNVAVKVAP